LVRCDVKYLMIRFLEHNIPKYFTIYPTKTDMITNSSRDWIIG
jgi:hypothetical protein